MQRNDEALGEKPLDSSSFSDQYISEILRDPQIFVGIGDGCRFGIKHPVSKFPLKKPTLWFSTSPEICYELGKRCGKKHAYDLCLEGHAGRYTKEIADAMHRGFVKTLRRKEPSRVRSLLRSVSRCLTSDVHKITPLRWSKRRFGKILVQWVGVTDAAGRSGDPPDVEMEGSV